MTQGRRGAGQCARYVAGLLAINYMNRMRAIGVLAGFTSYSFFLWTGWDMPGLTRAFFSWMIAMAVITAIERYRHPVPALTMHFGDREGRDERIWEQAQMASVAQGSLDRVTTRVRP